MIESTTCCGVRDIDGLSTRNNPRTAMKDFAIEYLESNEKAPIALFTGDMNYQYAQNFAKYIKKNKLGTIANSQKKLNPNSEHHIRAYLWSINKRNLKNFCLRNFPITFRNIFNQDEDN